MITGYCSTEYELMIVWQMWFVFTLIIMGVVWIA